MEYDTKIRENIIDKLRIISEYGEFIEIVSSEYMITPPKTILPYEIDVISESIKFIFKVLQLEMYREEIKKWNDDISENMLSNSFYESLKTGYMLLADFVDESDAILTYIQTVNLLKNIQQNSDKIEKLNVIISKMQNIPFYSNIQIRELNDDEVMRVHEIRKQIQENMRRKLKELQELENIF